MPISQSEQIDIQCGACGQSFETEIWSIVDVTERPDLAGALLDGTLNTATCSHCGVSNQSQVAMLYHDPAARKLNFAAPADVEEHRWRDRAQELIYALGRQLPEEGQGAYLNDIDVNLGIDSLRRAVQRRQRGRGTGAKPSFGKAIPLPGSGIDLPVTRTVEQPQVPSPKPQAPSPKPQVPSPQFLPLSDAIEHVMAVSSLDELRSVVLHYPHLLSDEADLMLRELADTAFNDGDRDLSTALHSARTALADLRAGREVNVVGIVIEHADSTPTLAEPVAVPMVPEPAYQALLHTASDAALIDAIRLFPTLLEPWADDDLARRTEAALDEGNERLAMLIEDRRDALGVLRLALTEPDVLEAAILGLLAADDTDAIERALNANPALLSDLALQALADYAAAARTRNDEPTAATADARRVTLGQVREGLG